MSERVTVESLRRALPGAGLSDEQLAHGAWLLCKPATDDAERWNDLRLFFDTVLVRRHEVDPAARTVRYKRVRFRVSDGEVWLEDAGNEDLRVAVMAVV